MLLILVTIAFDNMCTEAMLASVFVSFMSRVALSPLEEKTLSICDWDATE